MKKTNQKSLLLSKKTIIRLSVANNGNSYTQEETPTITTQRTTSNTVSSCAPNQ
jgi:hypothetical protein